MNLIGKKTKITTPAQQETQEKLERFRQTFNVHNIFFGNRSDGAKLVSWHEPTDFPAHYKFVAAGTDIKDALQNALDGQRLCNAGRIIMKFECALEMNHEGDCQPAVRTQ